APGTGRAFASLDEAILAHEQRFLPDADGDEQGLSVHAPIKLRMPAGRFPEDQFPVRDDEHADAMVLSRTGSNGDGRVLVETTLGRLLLNESFPPDFPYVDRVLRKRDVTELIGDLVELYPRRVQAE